MSLVELFVCMGLTRPGSCLWDERKSRFQVPLLPPAMLFLRLLGQKIISAAFILGSAAESELYGDKGRSTRIGFAKATCTPVCEARRTTLAELRFQDDSAGASPSKSSSYLCVLCLLVLA